MKRKICVRSMVLGAAIMLIGLAVGAIVLPPLIAQRDDVFGDIQCTGLTVVDKQGNVAVALDTDDANQVLVNDKQRKRAVALSSSLIGNMVAVYNKQGKEAVELTDTEYGGRFNVYNNQGKKRAGMGVNEYGNGTVNTWDKNGYR